MHENNHSVLNMLGLSLVAHHMNVKPDHSSNEYVTMISGLLVINMLISIRTTH
jgi:hypothetical protein